MSFLNQYSSIDIQIKSAKEFLENGILYDYAVGKSPESPCIMKTTTDGVVVWKKEYRIDGWSSEFAFLEIIQSKFKNGEIGYFLYASDNQEHFIISIDSNGNYIKIKRVKLFSTLGVFLVESKVNTNFYLAFSGLYEGNENTYGGNSLRQLMVLEFDTEIEIVNKNYYFTGSASDMLLNSVKSYLDGLLIVFDHKAGKTHLLDLKYDLSVRLHKEIHVGDSTYSDFFSHDLISVSSDVSNPKNSKYIVSGRTSEGKILLLAFDGAQQNYIYDVPQSVGLYSNMILVNNELYLNLFQSTTDKQGSVIHKMNINSFSNFSILWSKAFKIGKLFYGIKKLIKSNFNPVFIYPSYDESLLIDSPIDLTTCITVVLNYSLPSPVSFDVINRETGTNEISYECFPIDSMFIAERDVNPKNICEFALDPNPNGPCVKDEKLCDLYNAILLIFNNCLPSPSEESGNENYASQSSCFEQILSLIYDFDKMYPSYELLIHFESEIANIAAFIGSSNSESYQIAWSSVQSILNYLLNLGNCNCGDDLEITDNSLVQSGHLYLQSAGSVGQDSTKGIHLRWALKGALMEHLPKANYAFSTHHFNKANDFVKIHRAKYIEYKVVLDFSMPPLQVNEIGIKKSWLYQIGDKIFHVHFKDGVKYNQVRNSFNPYTDPSVFIKNYGNSLIEIENKTELSFKITPNFVIQNPGDSINLEVLSVQENKITAPKTASIRKQFTASELNSQPLVAENIRSIRFVGTNAYIGKIAFEFYSDFIGNAKNSNGWNYLGKYALTKETDEAFQRLEPQANCLQNWLRYNDDALVNTPNYQNKWNGSDLDELDKIATSVERYITLSDNIDNIRAIEIFPFENHDAVVACNLEDPDYDPADPLDIPDYDPYIADPTTETGAINGIEISYLNVLQFGSLDYHIARMLGLGTLDLNTLVFSGQYIYMAEYITLGDLGDGLGAREVQHLYCSLPTSLTDQRLSLPVNLKEIKEGVFFNNGYDGTEVDTEDDEGGTIPPGEQIPAIELTTNGYSPDGKTKYYTLYTEDFTEELFDAPFYYTNDEFISSEFTSPVFAGLEYRTFGVSDWNKPELSHSDYYYNIDTSGIVDELKNETIEFVIPESGQSLYTHGVKETGVLEYCSYGINWFSRATSSEIILQATTVISPKNELLPPTNVNATLIQQESPLLLTTAREQFLYGEIGDDEIEGNDKTMVRLTFDYNHGQELIDYHQKINGEVIPNYFELEDAKELFADTIQIYFRDQIPNSISGKVEAIIPNSNPLLLTIETSPYVLASTGESIIPSVHSDFASNFIGSILLVGDVEYVIHQIDISSTYPKFTIFKSDASGALVDLNTVIDPTNPLLSPNQGDLFIVVENMLNLPAWGSSNPSSYEINIDHVEVHREDEIIIKNTDCSTETHVQKFRGIYQQAEIHKIFEYVDENEDGEPDTDINGTIIERHLGLYKIIFPGFHLEEHSMNPPDANGNFVEWYNGIIRLHTLSDIGNEPRKNFKVVRTENIGTTNDLILYVEDLTFPADLNELDSYKGKLMLDDESSTGQMVNYYPSYKVYLYKDTSFGLTKENVLPQGDDDVRYTIFGLRSRDSINLFSNDFYSKISVPTLMFAQAIAEPVRPQLPEGGMYATRPDFFGKASYTFTTKYGTPGDPTKPYSVQFNRASDIQFISALYDNSVLGYDQDSGQPILNTVQEIMENIFLNGEEEFYVNRWNDLLNFEVYPNGEFSVIDGKQLPLPNSSYFIGSINAFIDAHNTFYQLTGTNAVPDLSPNFNLNTVVIPETPLNGMLLVKDFMKDILLNCFVPLTEIPIIYNYVNGVDYKPIPKKQVVRDRNGNLLKPEDADFDMAPMMKRIDSPNAQYESQFTDFGLDGASNAKYFYAVREINKQMKTSPYSEILGPISLVNTAPPVAPQILKVTPVLENRGLGITPAILLQINAYPKPQNITKISIYRADNPNDALLIRTMKPIKVLDLEVEGLVDNKDWLFSDDFSDLTQVPYGDTLYYRITVSRVIRYNNKALESIVDYTPSEASRLIVTNITENYSPVSPILNYTAGVYNATTDNVLDYITLNWEENVYKGNYHLYKMNPKGNWVEIIRVVSDRVTRGLYHFYNQDTQGNWINTIHPEPLPSVNGILYLPLELTNLATSSLATKTIDDKPIYHHFKVVSENTSGMFSKEENILTLYNAESYHSDYGIGPDTGEEGMIVQGNFIIRPN